MISSSFFITSTKINLFPFISRKASIALFNKLIKACTSSFSYEFTLISSIFLITVISFLSYLKEVILNTFSKTSLKQKVPFIFVGLKKSLKSSMVFDIYVSCSLHFSTLSSISL